MGEIHAQAESIRAYHDALELAEKLELRVTNVELGGKWSCPNGGSYHMRVPGNELRAIGQSRVFINTADGVKKCKPSTLPSNESRIELTFTDDNE